MEAFRDGQIVFQCDWCFKLHPDYRDLTVESRNGGELEAIESPSPFPGQLHACTRHRNQLLAGEKPPTWPHDVRSGTKQPWKRPDHVQPTVVTSDAAAANVTA